MTTRELREFAEGRDLYMYYLSHDIKGQATLRSDAALIKKMARLLDLHESYIKRCMSMYLWN